MTTTRQAQESANVILTQAQAIRQLRDAGYDPESVVKAVTDGDLSLIKSR